MKDIKSMMIGFLLATCMFLMMGQGSNDVMLNTNMTMIRTELSNIAASLKDIADSDNSKIGRYQMSTDYEEDHIFITTINTATGNTGYKKVWNENYQ